MYFKYMGNEQILLLEYKHENHKPNPAYTLWNENLEFLPLQVIDNKVSHKLTLTHKIEICKMLATGYSGQFISNEMYRLFGVKISSQAIYGNYNKGRRWKNRIERFRRAMDKQLMKHPAASKKNRIDILFKAVEMGISKGDTKGVASLMREIRIELEGEAPLIDASTHMHMKMEKYSDKKLVDEARARGIEIPPGIGSRVEEKAN